MSIAVLGELQIDKVRHLFLLHLEGIDGLLHLMNAFVVAFISTAN